MSHLQDNGQRNQLLSSTRVAWSLSWLCCFGIAWTVPTASALAQQTVLDKDQAKRIAREKGWITRQDAGKHGTIELHRIVNGIPLYLTTTNAVAAESIHTDEVLPGGSSGLDLTGAGIILGIWDGGGVRLTHYEMGGRAIQRDVPGSYLDHATHAGGTMIASGVSPAAKGMAPAGILHCYDWNNEYLEMLFAAYNGLRISNHSYGYITGWRFDWVGGDWYWYGDVNVSQVEDYYFGLYNSSSAEWDQIAFDYPYYLIVKSAGNDRDEGPTPGTGHWFIDPALGDWAWSTAERSPDGNDGYDTVGHRAVSKNVLTVGAVMDVASGYAGTGSVDMTSFSCWGPCDDGRIKPDVVANGYLLYSSAATADWDYAEYSGTSMAAPSTTGSLALLIEHHRNTHAGDPDMLGATLKALVIHTADECGMAAGPDYKFGWGLVNVLAAADTITADATTDAFTVSEHTIVNGEVFELSILTDAASDELRATIVWTDPPGSPPEIAVDPIDSMLINDLDLRVESNPGGTTYFPWILDPTNPSAPATTGDNQVDNIEQIVVPSPGTSAFTLRVTHDGTLLGGSQAFSLVITGAEQVLLDCNSNGTPDGQDISAGTSLDCNGNAIPDECDVDSGRSQDCNGNEIPDECEFADCNQNCLPDDCDIDCGNSGGSCDLPGCGLSQDCNNNTVPDECDISGGTSEDCNNNGIPDDCDILSSTSQDCNDNQIPDECDLENGVSQDCDENTIPDECDVAEGTSNDCNRNGIPDSCDLDSESSNDCNENSIPDECEFADCNLNCIADECDLNCGDPGGPCDVHDCGQRQDCNGNGIPDECDIAAGYSDDYNTNQTPDECENLELPGFIATLIAREGRTAPGVDGEYVSLLGTPSTNNHKEVAFWARTSFDDAIYVWSAGMIELRVLSRTSAPGTTEVFTSLGKSPLLNDDGVLVFSATLSGNSIRGLFRSDAEETIPIVVHGDPIPDLGGTFDLGPHTTSFSPSLTNAGEIYFRAHTSGVPGGFGESGAIFKYADGTISTVAATGIEYTNLGVFDSIAHGPWASPGGTVTFGASTDSLSRIIRVRDDVLDEVVKERDQAIGTSGAFARFDQPVSMAGPIDTYFGADTDGTPATGLFKHRLINDIVPLVLEGDSAPIVGNVFVNPRNARGNPLGDLYFYAQLSSGAPAAGLFKLDQQKWRTRSVLLQGDPAPAAGGLEVDDLSLYVLNSIGDMALQYKATDGARRILLLDQNLVGDFDHDDDVDLDDHDFFMDCLGGPGDVVPPGCEEADFDHDEDVDLNDFAVMQDVFIECEQSSMDCNGNGVGDECELLGSIATDCDDNGILDECDITFGGELDCNANWLPDHCDIDSGASYDYDENDIPDECENPRDCNFNAVGDFFDILQGTSEDCDENGVPDECELWDGPLELIGSFHDPFDSLVHLDPSYGHATSMFDSDELKIGGLATTCDGTLYALADSGEVLNMDPVTGAYTVIATHPFHHWAGAAYDCASQTLYGTATDMGVYRVSIEDGSLEQLSYTQRNFNGLAFDSENGILYGGVQYGLVWSIDTDDGFPTVLCDNLRISVGNGLTYDNGMLYAVGYGSYGTGLYQIDPNTCDSALIGGFGSGINEELALASWHDTTDCNDNNIPDNCDIDDGTSEDNNGNGTPDECDGVDCNSNGIPDEDELVVRVSLTSPQYTPFGHGYPGVYEIPAGLPAISDVVFRFDTIADLGTSDEYVTAILEGVGGIYGFSGMSSFGIQCSETPNWSLKNVIAYQYNRKVSGAEATITMTASENVDPFECTDDTFVSVSIEYLGNSDCNDNGVPDECDVAYGMDCNGNGIVDECEFEDCNNNCVPDNEDVAIGGGSLDCNNNLIPDECELDCNSNTVPDECDITDGASDDCNGNGIPDECEADCNNNGVADECDITDGTSEDCNGNGIPDECDIADGTSLDTNEDGIPDECATLLDPELTFDFTVISDDVYPLAALNNESQIVYRDDTGLHLVTGEGSVLKLRNSDVSDLNPHATRLNDRGQIAVHGRRTTSTDWEILRIESDQTADDVDDFVLIANSTGFPFSSFPYIGSLANTGQVAFRAESPVFSTTYVGDGTGGVHDPGSFVQPFPRSLFGSPMGSAGPVLSDSGLVAQVTTVGGTQVIVGIVGELPPAPTLSDYIFFHNYGEAGYMCAGAIAGSNNNKVAFRNQQAPNELILSDGTTQEVLATGVDTNQPLSINDRDEVAFVRENVSGHVDQVWITNGLVEVLVVQTGDVIGKFEVTRVDLGPQAYNNTRQILITVGYEASPGGEQKTALLFGTPVLP